MDEQHMNEGTATATVEGAAKVLRASSGSEAGAQIIHTRTAEADHGASQEGVAEAARVLLRAGEQAVDKAKTAGQALTEAGHNAGLLQTAREWAEYGLRATRRNVTALGEFTHCRTPYNILQWQANLITANVNDWVDTARRNSGLAVCNVSRAADHVQQGRDARS